MWRPGYCWVWWAKIDHASCCAKLWIANYGCWNRAENARWLEGGRLWLEGDDGNEGAKDAAVIAVVYKCLIFCFVKPTMILLIHPSDKDSLMHSAMLPLTEDSSALGWDLDWWRESKTDVQIYLKDRGKQLESLVACECQAIWAGFKVVALFSFPGICRASPLCADIFFPFLFPFSLFPTLSSFSSCTHLLSLRSCHFFLFLSSPLKMILHHPIYFSLWNWASWSHSPFILFSFLSFSILLTTFAFKFHFFSLSPPSLSITFTTPLTLSGTLPYDIKIVIAGNHELTFDQEFMADLIKQDFYYFPSASKLKPENYENVQSLLTNCIYLQDSEVTVRGFRIYGSPWWVTLSAY